MLYGRTSDLWHSSSKDALHHNMHYTSASHAIAAPTAAGKLVLDWAAHVILLYG